MSPTFNGNITVKKFKSVIISNALYRKDRRKQSPIAVWKSLDSLIKMFNFTNF